MLSEVGFCTNYYMTNSELRLLHLRETALSKYTDPVEREQKRKDLEYNDICKKRALSKERRGTKNICINCGKEYIVTSSLQPLCMSCCHRDHHIFNAGSYEAFVKQSLSKQEKTKQEKYGDKHYNNRQKCKETCQQKYGVDSIFEVESVKEKAKKTKIDKYGDAYYNNQEKCKKTNQERYGVNSTLAIPEVHAKTIQTTKERYSGKELKEKAMNTMQEKYGDRHYDSTKAKLAMLEKYGVEYPYQVPEFLEKMKSTLQDRYGVDSFSKTYTRKLQLSLAKLGKPLSAEAKEKMIKTTLERYGTFIHTYTYEYDNKIFDSSWELAYYIWLKDNNIQFIYKPDRLEYKDGNVSHYYYPDFKVEDTLTEIKGDHLMKDGWLVDYKGNILKAKTLFLREQKVKFLFMKDIQQYINYVNNTYGQNFLNSCRRTNAKD